MSQSNLQIQHHSYQTINIIFTEIEKKNVLVSFPTADKEIPKTGQLTKEKFIGLTVPHAWGDLTILAEGKEEQVTSYADGSRQKGSLYRATPVLKINRSRETHPLS